METMYTFVKAPWQPAPKIHMEDEEKAQERIDQMSFRIFFHRRLVPQWTHRDWYLRTANPRI
jgi:hypothetical protein